MDRRQFIKSVGTVAAGTAVATKLGGLAEAADKATATKAPAAAASRRTARPDIVAVRNGEPDKMFRKGIEALGGMKAFIKPRQKVIIKPNASFDLAPEFAANTNPVLMGEIVRQALAAGAAEVNVFDHTLNSWRTAYKNSGIEEAVTRAGGKMLPANDQRFYVPKKNGRAKALKETDVFKALLEADVFINVPILKNHGGTRMSCAIKNLMGCVWDRRIMHRNDLHQSIAEQLLYMKPVLNVVDAYRILTANGPRGSGLKDAKVIKYQLISTDIVAIDSLSTQIMEYKLDEVPYIKIAEGLGFGKSDTAKLNISRLEA
jgi:uncharacterized protein (DUF362 family)